ncbi:MAG: twin-arginine translocation signal domain-containing protein, partial [Methyloglobulus sp.]|nr:twin-arginine translocation signal domain-containing protein [Methyloglobulus sp.]
MKIDRRKFLKTSFAIGAVGMGLIESSIANAEWLAADFAPGSFDTAMKQLLKGKPI